MYFENCSTCIMWVLPFDLPLKLKFTNCFLYQCLLYDRAVRTFPLLIVDNFALCMFHAGCQCDLSFSTGECEESTGRCKCRPEYTGLYCDQCSVGYFGYPRCVPCECNVNGTQGAVCEVGGGQCPCKANYEGRNCDRCSYGYYGFPDCKREYR